MRWPGSHLRRPPHPQLDVATPRQIVDVLGWAILGRRESRLQRFRILCDLIRQHIVWSRLCYSNDARQLLPEPRDPAALEDATGAPISASLFLQRFSHLFNSFQLASIGSYPTLGEFQPSNGMIPTSAQTSRNFETKRCKVGWMVALFLAATLLVAASLGAEVLRLGAPAPELRMPSWSAGMRANSYFSQPDTGPFIDDDTERGRLLRDEKITFGDVTPDQSTGHLSVSSPDAETPVAKVKRSRLHG